MPRFVYKCMNCGNVFDMFVKNSTDKVSCPNCNCGWVRKKFTSSTSPSSTTQASQSSGCG